MQTFHKECLVLWGRSSCPVFYLINFPGFLKYLGCMDCGGHELTWHCLICGYIGCSEKEERHTLDHYKQTQHKFVVELKGFRVWHHEKGIWLHKLDGAANKEVEVFSKSSDIEHEHIKCSCPVCHYKKTPRLLKHYSCMKCNIIETKCLWHCLTCGHVGCDRKSKRHALEQHTLSHHPHVMRVEDLIVWHYETQKEANMILHEPEIQETVYEDAKENPESSSSTPSYVNDGTLTQLSAIDLSTDFGTIVDQRNPLANRLNLLEIQWQEFENLTVSVTNKIINSIEEHLLDLKDGIYNLDKKFGEQEIRFIELFTKLNKLRDDLIRSAEFNGNINPHATRSSAVPPVTNDTHKTIATAIVIGLAAFCTLKYVLRRTIGGVTNLV